jgi:ATP-dependent helicase/nuclease subunit A
MTRAKERLIVSGAIDREKKADASTPIGWVLGRLGADEELDAAGDAPVEIERNGARLVVRVDRFREADWIEPAEAAEPPVEEGQVEEGQLALFAAPGQEVVPVAPAPVLAALVAPAEPPLHHVRRLSFTALSTFEQCSYKYYSLYVARLKERRPEHRGGDGGLRATEVGDAVHKLLEQVDLSEPAVPDLEQVRVWYPTVSDEELERIRAYVASYCESDLARRVAACERVDKERHFTFEHDGVLLHGFVDVLQLDGPRALVLDYKTNLLGESAPEAIVEADYGLQRLVYALACFRAGAEEVEVVYHFLERADAVVSTTFDLDQVPELESVLSAGIARIQAAEFRPQPSEFACSTCPALDLVCGGPRLSEPSGALEFSSAA